jgi:hypothetical protein
LDRPDQIWLKLKKNPKIILPAKSLLLPKIKGNWFPTLSLILTHFQNQRNRSVVLTRFRSFHIQLHFDAAAISPATGHQTLPPAHALDCRTQLMRQIVAPIKSIREGEEGANEIAHVKFETMPMPKKRVLI